MRTESDIHAMLDKLDKRRRQALPRGDVEAEELACMMDALLWVLGDKSGKNIDPDARD